MTYCATIGDLSNKHYYDADYQVFIETGSEWDNVDSGGDVPQLWSVKKNRPVLSERIREDDCLLNHNRAVARKSIIQYFVTALLVSSHSFADGLSDFPLRSSSLHTRRSDWPSSWQSNMIRTGAVDWNGLYPRKGNLSAITSLLPWASQLRQGLSDRWNQRRCRASPWCCPC